MSEWKNLIEPIEIICFHLQNEWEIWELSGHLNVYKKCTDIEKTNKRNMCYMMVWSAFCEWAPAVPPRIWFPMCVWHLPGSGWHRLNIFVYRIDAIAIVPGPCSDPIRIQMVSCWSLFLIFSRISLSRMICFSCTKLICPPQEFNFPCVFVTFRILCDRDDMSS